MTAFRYSSGLPGAPRTDMYINVQCKTSWSPLGLQVANLAPTLLKPAARGRVTLPARDAQYPCVEFNFVGEELDLHRFMQGFRHAFEILAHEKVRAMSSITFPVKFTDRLRRLNRITPANKLKSGAIAKLIDVVPSLAGPIFSTLADRRVDLATLVEDDDALAEHIRENVAGCIRLEPLHGLHRRPRCRGRCQRARSQHWRPAGGRCIDHADRRAAIPTFPPLWWRKRSRRPFLEES
jgi:5-(hydroxymethyl)furfural/furfural oxidase